MNFFSFIMKILENIMNTQALSQDKQKQNNFVINFVSRQHFISLTWNPIVLLQYSILIWSFDILQNLIFTLPWFWVVLLIYLFLRCSIWNCFFFFIHFCNFISCQLSLSNFNTFLLFYVETTKNDLNIENINLFWKFIIIKKILFRITWQWKISGWLVLM